MLNDPCKSVLQMVQILKNACEHRCESYECVANATRTRRTNLYNTHCGSFSLSHICQPLSNQLIFLQICTDCLHFVLHSTEMSIRMLANLYKRLTTTTDALPTIRMARDWLQICCERVQLCCEYAFLAYFMSMFLVTPQNRARMLT